MHRTAHRASALLLAAILPAAFLVAAPSARAGDHPACPAEGDCFVKHGSPGCEVADCCNAVCDVDLFCCKVHWDSLCVEEAQGVCQPVCSREPCAKAPACSSDLDGDGMVGEEDLGLLLAAWGGSPGACPDFDCNGVVDGSDLGVLLADWGGLGSLHAGCTGAVAEGEPCGADVNGGCDAPPCGGASDCCSAHVGAGCDDPACEAMVCGQDPFCCEALWDAVCHGAACRLCAQTCTPAPPPVTPIACGATVCGSAWALDGARDTDWYELDLSDRVGVCQITATLTASFPATALFIYDAQCDPMTLGAGEGGCPNVATACVPPGVYRVFVSHSVANGFPCESGQNDYLLRVECDCDASCAPIDCGVAGAGDCCTPHGTPFCDDAACCEAVCGIVPFCCDVEWDANCVFWSLDLCGVCQAPGACCLTDGTCMQVSGPMECNDFAGDFLGAGSVCDGARCPVICGPDSGDCCADGGHFNPGCSDPACCVAVCTGDPFCCNFQWDASCAEEAERLCAVCALPGACCLKDGSCVQAEGAAACEALGGEFVGAGVACDEAPCAPICGPGAGDCFASHATPGCEDAGCCFTVCAFDAYCCDVAWDSICVDQAESFCITCGPPTFGRLECVGTDEGEPCGDDLNGGCNAEPPVYGAISCGETVCGTAWADGDVRDTDWFAFTVEGEANQIVTVVLEADFANATLVILSPDCPANGFAVGEGHCTTVASACLPPGDYVVFVSQGVFEGFPCDGAVRYALTLDCTGEECAETGCGSITAGDCCIADKTPFCSDAGCCETVCRSDPFCCEVEWDQECADQAGVFCDVCS